MFSPLPMALQSTNPCRILLIGNDDVLLRVRGLVLKREGYDVVETRSLDAPEGLNAFDIVLLCGSLGAGQANTVARATKAARPELPVIRLSPSTYDHSTFFDFTCDPLSGPRALLSALKRWNSKSSRQASA